MNEQSAAERDSQFWLLSTSLTIVLSGVVIGLWEQWSRDRTDFESLPNPLIAIILSAVTDGTVLLLIRRRGMQPSLAVVHGIALAGVLLSAIPFIDLLVDAA